MWTSVYLFHYLAEVFFEMCNMFIHLLRKHSTKPLVVFIFVLFASCALFAVRLWSCTLFILLYSFLVGCLGMDIYLYELYLLNCTFWM